ncbi:MAG: response regulator [Bacteroidales bacterium]
MIDSTLKNGKILIIDDKEANVDVLEGFLEMQGYTNIKTTTDPRLAASFNKSFAPDLVLLDLMMPYLSGFEVMEQLKASTRAKGSYLPILILTADITTESKQRALANGASDFLTKPFDLIEVGLRIKNLLFTSYLMQQAEIQNQILEIKVKERTKELQDTNVSLMLARDRAEASDRLKTSFMNNISHEIRTPLNGILGFAPMILDPTYTQEEKHEFLEILEISGRRLMHTVADYMDISLIASGNMEMKYEKFEPAEVIDEIELEYSPECKSKDISFSIVYPENFRSIEVNSDRFLIKKVLAYLVDNAIKFTLKGEIKIGIEVNSNSLEFSVTDTGIGISKELLPFIFDRFTQADESNTRRFEGSGLGLAIAKGIAELLGGSISVESQKGKGSTFCFSVPAFFGNLNREITQKASLPKANGAKAKILVVEDDTFSFHFLYLALNATIQVIHAENGLQAVELCQSNPDIKLVLMDIKLPKMNGLVATQEIKKFRKDIPIIAFTSYALAGDRKKCLDAGCDEYITKPLALDDLFKVLNRFGIYGK